jgi:outer membrane biogenesis lipoprotein LolB
MEKTHKLKEEPVMDDRRLWVLLTIMIILFMTACLLHTNEQMTVINETLDHVQQITEEHIERTEDFQKEWEHFFGEDRG